MPVYKDEQRATYYCKFNYTDYLGKKRTVFKRGFKLQKEAKAYEVNFLANLVCDSNILFSALVDKYLEYCKARVKPTTYKSKANIIKTRILPFFEKYPINKITTAIVDQYQTEILKSGYSATYANGIHTNLSAIFNYAMKNYNLKINPARNAGNIGQKLSKRVNFWTLEEFQKFIDTLHIKNPLQRKKCSIDTFDICYKILFFGGLRIGECLALTINDFDTDTNQININKTYAIVERKEIIQSPKTKKSIRKVTLPPKVAKQLKDYLGKLPCTLANQRIFEGLSTFALAECLNRTAPKANLKTIHIHDLRHSHASLLIEQGFSPLVIADRLGHESIKTTLEIYSHLYPGKDKEVSQKLDTLAF